MRADSRWDVHVLNPAVCVFVCCNLAIGSTCDMKPGTTGTRLDVIDQITLIWKCWLEEHAR